MAVLNTGGAPKGFVKKRNLILVPICIFLYRGEWEGENERTRIRRRRSRRRRWEEGRRGRGRWSRRRGRRRSEDKETNYSFINNNRPLYKYLPTMKLECFSPRLCYMDI